MEGDLLLNPEPLEAQVAEAVVGLTRHHQSAERVHQIKETMAAMRLPEPVALMMPGAEEGEPLPLALTQQTKQVLMVVLVIQRERQLFMIGL